MDSKNLPPFVDIQSAHQALRISRSLFLKLVKEGSLPAPIKIGTRSIWDTEKLIESIKTIS